MDKAASILRYESQGFSAAYDGDTTTISRQIDRQTPDVTLSCEAERLDVLAAILRRDAWSGTNCMPDNDRTILIEVIADVASEVSRLAELTEMYVNRLQAAKQ